MKEASKMSSLTICEDTRNVTSLPASESGVTPSGRPGGLMTDQSGQAVAPANHSARQAKEKGCLMSGTFGPVGSSLSTSLNLRLSLANKLRQKTDLVGSTLFRLTWKDRVTPLGRSICALRASALRTSASGCTSWPTARQTDGEKNVRTLDGSLREIARKGSPQDLNQAAVLANWPTPRGNDGTGSKIPPGREGGVALKTAASWATPTARDHKGGASVGTAPINGLLGRQVWVASWPTPMAGTPAQKGYNEAGNTDSGRKTVALVASGKTPNGSTAKTESIGQLNPEHSRWLMGLPKEWGSCADTATHCVRKSPKASSKRT